jgi:transglutaminase-like putative cysteine protease
MRFFIRHETNFQFEPSARFLNGLLRLTPRNHEGQFVAKWRLALDVDGRLKPSDDALGNIVHGVALAGPRPGLTLRVEGEVSTFDTAGVLRGTLERFPPAFFLRETPLTAAHGKLSAYCQEAVVAVAREVETLPRLHDLLAILCRDLAWNQDMPDDPDAASAAAVFAKRKGDAAGLAHVFIACAHQLAIPARFVRGYCVTDEGAVSKEVLHCWAEAHVEELGWVGFDPALGRCPTETHVRVACGLDSAGTATTRIVASGADETTRSETIHLVHI